MQGKSPKEITADAAPVVVNLLKKPIFMVKAINLVRSSKRLFFLIHGYTGSPTDFNGLPQYLHKRYRADVRVMLLPGHGTKIEDLDDLKFQDFFRATRKKLEENLKKYDKIIIGGVSFGAQLALILAARYSLRGVFIISLPYKLKFPFNVPGLRLLGHFKKYWSKIISKNEQRLRRQAFHYKQMHINGLQIVKEANQEMKKALPRIKCPVLAIHSFNDPVGSYHVLQQLAVELKAPCSKKLVITKSHNLFFSDERFELYERIANFSESTPREDKPEKNGRVAAIIPAYNEGGRIGEVLGVLSRTKILDEIIVVDDGSTDNTSEAASKFARVKLLKNSANKGKAQALQKGIDATTADILFFCDADLKNLTPAIINQIVRPVIKQRYDMFIGVRNNVLQKAVTLFALNSGERALRRELWDKLPDNFKFRYRLEAGLNFTVRAHGQSYGWRRFNYYQTLKERKYGLLRGALLRWRMSFDVGCAYFLSLAGIAKGRIINDQWLT